MTAYHAPIQVTFLGTGTSQGVPVIACPCEVCHSTDSKDKRLRSSIAIETGGKVIVIDSGPDFRQQMLRADIRRLDAILYTHNHKDHVAGLDDVRAYNYIQQSPMQLFAESYVKDTIEREFAYIFDPDPYPGVPTVNIHCITESPFEAAGIPVQPIRAIHYKLPILGFRIGKFAYLTDANYIAPEEKKKLLGVTHLVVNALRQTPHISHFSLNEAISVIQETGATHGYITHIGHQMGKAQEVKTLLPPHIQLAYDGLQIEIA